MIPVLGLITEALGIGRDWLAASRQRKQAKLESDLKINEARTEAVIKKVQTAQSADIAWNNLSIEKSGWKDEFFTIILSIPLVMCFIPGGAPYVQAGFEALDASTPEWFRYAFLVAVASSFGFRKLADFMSLKKGD